MEYVHVVADLKPGKRILFYTDGLTEARNANQDEYDVPGLIRFLEAHVEEPMRPLLDALVRDAAEFTGMPIFEDDVCILGVNYVGK